MRYFKKRYKIKKKENLSNFYLANIQFSVYGLKAEVAGILTAKQLEACRRVITRETQRSCKLLIRIFFFQPITKKPAAMRMGRGCGVVKNWIFYIKKGLILLESARFIQSWIFNAFKKASTRLPICVKFIYRDFYSLNSSNW